MIGGRFGKVSSAAMIAAAAIVSGGIAAQAADLGGNCCADLEERVAELEATTARKGNRKVSLTVSGHVNESILFWDDGVGSGARVVTNGFSMTRFRFLGSAKINADWSAGFLLEFGLGRTGMSYAVDQLQGSNTGTYDPAMRHQALWIKSRSLGTLWMGHTTDAVDGIIDICLGCPITSSPESQLGWGAMRAAVGNVRQGTIIGGFGNAGLRVGNEGHYGTRRNLIKYISPTFAGFSASASWGDADNGTVTSDHDYIWNAALRYAGEFGAFRVAAGIGYTDDGAADVTSYAGSASIAHVPTGLYVQGAFAHKEAFASGINPDDDMWSVQVGVAQKWSTLGKTTLWVQYQEYDNGRSTGLINGFAVNGTDAQIISGGINQKIDAAAMELYLTYWNIQADVATAGGVVGLNDLNIIMAGTRIRF